MVQGGLTANNNGQKLENKVQFYYVNNGYKVLTCKEFENLSVEEVNNQKLLIKNYPYTSIYGTKGRTEFLAINKGFRTRIECKAQFSAGSVDEKLPYLMLNAIHAFPEDKVTIVHEGDGFKTGAVEWLKRSAEVVNNDNTNKTINVIHYNELKKEDL